MTTRIFAYSPFALSAGLALVVVVLGINMMVFGLLTPSVGEVETMGVSLPGPAVGMLWVLTGSFVIFTTTWIGQFSLLPLQGTERYSQKMNTLGHVAAASMIAGGVFSMVLWLGIPIIHRLFFLGTLLAGVGAIVWMHANSPALAKSYLHKLSKMTPLMVAIPMVLIIATGVMSAYTGEFITGSALAYHILTWMLQGLIG